MSNTNHTNWAWKSELAEYDIFPTNDEVDGVAVFRTFSEAKEACLKELRAMAKMFQAAARELEGSKKDAFFTEGEPSQTHRVHVLGPNTRDGLMHIHAEGCSDVHRRTEYKSREFDHDRVFVYEVSDLKDLVEVLYDGQLSDNGWEGDDESFIEAGGEMYLSSFKVFDCCKGLK